VKTIIPAILALTTTVSVAASNMEEAVIESISKTEIGRSVEGKVDRVVRWSGIDSKYSPFALSLADAVANDRFRFGAYMFGARYDLSVKQDNVLITLKISF